MNEEMRQNIIKELVDVVNELEITLFDAQEELREAHAVNGQLHDEIAGLKLALRDFEDESSKPSLNGRLL